MIHVQKVGSLLGELYNVSFPQSEKVELEISTISHVHEVETFNWRA